MPRSYRFLSVLCVLLLSQLAQAQEIKPTMTVIISSEKKTLDDFRMVMVDLAGSKNEYETLADAIRVLVDGIDENKPMSWRNYLRGKETYALNTATVMGQKGLTTFLASLRDLGYTTRRELAIQGLYRMGGEDNGSLFFSSKDNLIQMVPIGKTRVADLQKGSHAFATLIKSPPPDKLLKGKDLVFYLENNKDQTADRKSVWSKMVSGIVKAIETKKEKETEPQFKLRVAAGKQQLEELERFFVEAETARIDWSISKMTRSARAEVDFRAPPDTQLASGIKNQETAPNDFTDIGEDKPLSRANVTIPINEMRRRHVHELAKAWMPALGESIDKNPDHTPAERATYKVLVEFGTEVAHGVADHELFNGFVRLYGTPKAYTSLGAVKMADSSKLLPILKKLEGHKGVTLKLDADKEGDMAIHSVVVDSIVKRAPNYFDKSGAVYIGIAPNMAWYAFGEGGLDRMKKAYQAVKAGGPKTGGPIVDAYMSIAPWAEFVDLLRGKGGDPAVRRYVVDALRQGKDTVTLKLEKVEDSIKGFAQFDEGILRAAGKIIAKFVKENIE